MTDISLKNISKIYRGNIEAVRDFSLDISDGEFVVFVGPSGCGKSTVLRMIAGLEDITAGDLYIDGRRMNDVRPQERDIAMIFQNYALYPHLTVYENLAFSLRIKKYSRDEIDSRVRAVAEKTGILHLLDRMPKTLSGGEKQRVAMGRAIVRKPQLFLMDEPLSNLDAELRVKIRREICRLYRELKATIIYVTHDQIEAMSLGTKIVVMKKGVIQQVGTADELYSRPCNMFVAGFIGTPKMNMIEMEVKDEGEIYLKNSDFIIQPDKNKQRLLKERGYAGKTITVGIRAENIRVEAGGDFKIDEYEGQGADCCGYIALKGYEIAAKLPKKLVEEKIRDVSIGFDENMLHLFDIETGKAVVSENINVQVDRSACCM